jgi:sugar/nucleoside kinase (ribokinase family)
MRNKLSVVVAGHICLDIFPDLKNVPTGKFMELFQPGHMLQIGPPHFSTGGPVSNTGLAMHILGLHVNLIGKIGDDMYGRAVLQLLQKYDNQLTHDMIIDPFITTSYTLVISPPGFDRMFLHHPGANHLFTAEDIDFNSLKSASLFHFGYPPVMKAMYDSEGDQLMEVFQRAKESGLTTSLDMCFPDPDSDGGKANWVEILKKTLPYVDIFVPSFDEILYMMRRGLYDNLWQSNRGLINNQATVSLLLEISKELFDLGTKIVFLKLGDRGAFLRTSGAEILETLGPAKPNNIDQWINKAIWSPCYRVNVAGTTGSGDATIAGFLSAILQDFSACQALNSAVAVGACNVEAPDSLSGVQSWETTQARISAGWLKHELSIDAPGWYWDKEQQLWIGMQDI